MKTILMMIGGVAIAALFVVVSIRRKNVIVPSHSARRTAMRSMSRVVYGRFENEPWWWLRLNYDVIGLLIGLELATTYIYPMLQFAEGLWINKPGAWGKLLACIYCCTMWREAVYHRYVAKWLDCFRNCGDTLIDLSGLDRLFNRLCPVRQELARVVAAAKERRDEATDARELCFCVTVTLPLYKRMETPLPEPECAAFIRPSNGASSYSVLPGQIPFRKIGKRLIFIEEELQQVIDAAPDLTIDDIREHA